MIPFTILFFFQEARPWIYELKFFNSNFPVSVGVKKQNRYLFTLFLKLSSYWEQQGLLPLNFCYYPAPENVLIL